MTFRLATYAVAISDGQVLLVRHLQPDGTTIWTLPGGRVEQSEDPFDAVVREVAEETGHDAKVLRLLGIDSRVIPATEAHSGVEHQNVGVFYEVEIAGGQLRNEPNGDTVAPTWTPLTAVDRLTRSSLVDVGLTLEGQRPPTGHVHPIAVGGLIQH